jgi:predicted phosphodiesterase
LAASREVRPGEPPEGARIAPRTLIISDLHIGARGRSAVLERPAVLQRLLAAVEGVDRLVLLGDVVELLGSRPRRSFESAVPVLRAIGSCLGRDREVVIVPGNHDRPLLRAWLRDPGRRLDVATLVPADASPRLAALVEALEPARVSVRYPGVWLTDRGYALHGHYLDRHLWPVSAYGVLRGGRSSPGDSATPMDYERSGRVHLSPVTRWLPGPLGSAVESFAEVARASTMPRIRSQVVRPEVAPVTARLLGQQMRHHSLPALARVIESLGISADWVVFGHVHRLGPIAGDDPAEWRARPGGTLQSGSTSGADLFNTGSWLYEPRLVHRAEPPHPYWPGGAVVVEAGSAPRAVNLLEDLPGEALRGGAGGLARAGSRTR